jgi:hypothetical protein
MINRWNDMQQFELILKSETLFAREVALGVVVTQPLKSWCYLIPGMFIIDFLRRQKAIRQFSREYLFPRRHALYCAKALMDGMGREQIEAWNAAHVAQWPTKAHPGKAEASRSLQLQVIELLIPHYRKLLAAQGGTYLRLLASAYPERQELKRFLEGLNRLEQDRDRNMPEEEMGSRWSRHIDTIHNQVDMRRTRLIDEVY